MTKKKISRSRNWCFTDFERMDFDKIYHDSKEIIRYCCYGNESCPKTHKIHFQGWIQFFNPRSMISVKKILGSKKIHLEACRGDEYANDKYCKKDDDFRVFGKFISQGMRTDLEDIKRSIDRNKPMKELWDSHFGTMLRYHSGVTKYRQVALKNSTRLFRDVYCTIYSGSTGTGKTKKALEENPDAFKIEGSSLKWWDGYEGEKTLVIDEYNNDIQITKLLSILDGYQLRLPIKGGFTYANWEKVIITTNLKKEEIHAQAKYAHQDALARRVDDFLDFQ